MRRGCSGGTDPLRPSSNSEVHLFRNGKGVINLNAQIPDGALNLGVAAIAARHAGCRSVGKSGSPLFVAGNGCRTGVGLTRCWQSTQIEAERTAALSSGVPACGRL